MAAAEPASSVPTVIRRAVQAVVTLLVVTVGLGLVFLILLALYVVTRAAT